MKLVQSLLAIVLAGSMGSSVAAVGPGYLGDLVGQDIAVTHSIPGLGVNFTDIYSFDIGALSAETIATTVRVTLQYDGSNTPVFDISNFSIALADINNVQYAFDNSFSNGALELSAVLAPSVVGVPGFYTFVVNGTTTGSAGGLYAGALSAQAVPEPQTWMTLVAGIGLIGMMVGRSKRRMF